MNNRGFTLVELIATTIILLILAAVMFGATGCTRSTENEVTGSIAQVELSGFPYKTWRGELHKGDFGTGRKRTTVVYEGSWAFVVKDSSVVSQIVNASQRGKFVKLRYDTEWVINPFMTRNVVTSVEVIGPKGTAVESSTKIEEFRERNKIWAGSTVIRPSMPAPIKSMTINSSTPAKDEK